MKKARAQERLEQALEDGRWESAREALTDGAVLTGGGWEENLLARTITQGKLAQAGTLRTLLEGEEAFVRATPGARGTQSARERDPRTGRGMLGALAQACAREDIDAGEAQAMVEVLVAHGADPDAVDRDGRGPAAHAAREAGARNPALVVALAGSARKGHQADAALEEAMALGDEKLAKALLAQCKGLKMSGRAVGRAVEGGAQAWRTLNRMLAEEDTTAQEVHRLDREGERTIAAQICARDPGREREEDALEIIETLRRKGGDLGESRTRSDPLGACIASGWSAGIEALINAGMKPRGRPLSAALARSPVRSSQGEALERWLEEAVRKSGHAAQRACAGESGRNALTEAAVRESAHWMLGALARALGGADTGDARGRTALGECAREAARWAGAAECARRHGGDDTDECARERANAAAAETLVRAGANPWEAGEGGRNAAQLGAGSCAVLKAMEILPEALTRRRARQLAHAACDAGHRGAPECAARTLRWMADAGVTQACAQDVLERMRAAFDATAPRRGRYALDRASATLRIDAMCDAAATRVVIDVRGGGDAALDPRAWLGEAEGDVLACAGEALGKAPHAERGRLAQARVWVVAHGTDPALARALEEALD